MLEDACNFPLSWISSPRSVWVRSLLPFLQQLEDLDRRFLDLSCRLLPPSALSNFTHVTTAFLGGAAAKELLACRVHCILILLRCGPSCASFCAKVFAKHSRSRILGLSQGLLVCI